MVLFMIMALQIFVDAAALSDVKGKEVIDQLTLVRFGNIDVTLYTLILLLLLVWVVLPAIQAIANNLWERVRS